MNTCHRLPLSFAIATLLLGLIPTWQTISREPKNLTFAQKRVINYYDNGAYEKDLNKALNRAWKKIKKIPATPMSYVLFDVDDTVLSTYQAAKNIGFGNALACSGPKDNLPAIKPVYAFYKKLIDHGFKIIFLTHRSEELRNATKRNLYKQGFDTYTQLILRQPSMNKVSPAQFKAQERAKLVEQGHHIVACVGDQKSDMLGAHTGIKVKLPNPMYII